MQSVAHAVKKSHCLVLTNLLKRLCLNWNGSVQASACVWRWNFDEIKAGRLVGRGCGFHNLAREPYPGSFVFLGGFFSKGIFGSSTFSVDFTAQDGKDLGARSSRSPWGASRAPLLPGFVPTDASSDLRPAGHGILEGGQSEAL